MVTGGVAKYIEQLVQSKAFLEYVREIVERDYEVKRNKQKNNLSVLENKAIDIVRKYPQYNIVYLGLSLDDM